MSLLNVKQDVNTVKQMNRIVNCLHKTACCIAVMALLGVTQAAYAKDKPVSGKQTPLRAQASVKVQGDIRGFEKPHKRSDGVFVVPGHVSGQGKVNADHVILEGIVSPGNSPGCIDFSGNLTFSATATLVIELGGIIPCSEYDQINVANTLTINNATLQLILLHPFMPQFGDSFNVLNWGTLAGSGFSSIDTSAATLTYPFEWDFSELYVTGEVKVGVINIADGDLAPWDNPDGNINAADFMIATQLVLDQRVYGALQLAHGDINDDGVIDVVDLLLIQQLVIQN